MIFVQKKFNPWLGVEFLPDTKKRKALHIFSVTTIVASAVLLAYPFLGNVQYFLKDAKPSGTSLTPIVNETKTNEPAEESAQTEVLANEYVEPKSPIPRKEPIEEKAVDPIIHNVIVHNQTQPTNAEVPVEQKIDPVIQNRIIIPKIGVNMVIEGGRDADVLNDGVAWWIPGTSNPNYGGNFVLGGHRYAFGPETGKTFWNLDKLEIGDIYTVEWEGTAHMYEVYEIDIVEPNKVEILAPTNEDINTLFTCTPIFTSKQRLVVRAKPI